MKLTEAEARRGVELHERIRAFLVATMPTERLSVIGSALAYEFVSLMAACAETGADAHQLIEACAAHAREQIAAFGVGRMHP